MTTSKTTVLGIRLDHERRGWIEAEAARQGVSIRAYFERMIDEARSVDEGPEEPTEPIATESAPDVASAVDDDTAADATSEAWPDDGAAWVPEPPPGSPHVSPTASPGLCDDLVSVAATSGRVLRDALGLPCALINVATRRFRRRSAF
jgi:hypothetical protein